jgi:hypothetical protein
MRWQRLQEQGGNIFWSRPKSVRKKSSIATAILSSEQINDVKGAFGAAAVLPLTSFICSEATVAVANNGGKRSF